MSGIEKLAEAIEKPLKQLGEVFKEWYANSGIEEKMPPTAHKIALKHYKQGDIEKATHYFEKCLEKHGIYGLTAETRANCANYLSKIYNDLGSDSKVLQYLVYAAETIPDNIVYQKNLAGYHWNKKDFSAAYSQARKCAALDAGDDQHYIAAKDECIKIAGLIEPYINQEVYQDL